ncbi:IS3 family transposase [Limosilactobacillus vaginalis]|uniref:IS3 family transposase n=1 Tax=Limosilactobacillus vaginalis TaxID=1633 RepID=UPI003AAA5CD6
MLTYFGIPRSTFYERLKASQRIDKYRQVKQEIAKQFIRSKETYGYRRIWYCLMKQGFTYCQETVRRLMTSMGLKVTLYSSKSHYHSYVVIWVKRLLTIYISNLMLEKHIKSYTRILLKSLLVKT